MSYSYNLKKMEVGYYCYCESNNKIISLKLYPNKERQILFINFLEHFIFALTP